MHELYICLRHTHEVHELLLEYPKPRVRICLISLLYGTTPAGQIPFRFGFWRQVAPIKNASPHSITPELVVEQNQPQQDNKEPAYHLQQARYDGSRRTRREMHITNSVPSSCQTSTRKPLKACRSNVKTSQT